MNHNHFVLHIKSIIDLFNKQQRIKRCTAVEFLLKWTWLRFLLWIMRRVNSSNLSAMNVFIWMGFCASDCVIKSNKLFQAFQVLHVWLAYSLACLLQSYHSDCTIVTELFKLSVKKQFPIHKAAIKCAWALNQKCYGAILNQSAHATPYEGYFDAHVIHSSLYWEQKEILILTPSFTSRFSIFSRKAQPHL